MTNNKLEPLLTLTEGYLGTGLCVFSFNPHKLPKEAGTVIGPLIQRRN